MFCSEDMELIIEGLEDENCLAIVLTGKNFSKILKPHNLLQLGQHYF